MTSAEDSGRIPHPPDGDGGLEGKVIAVAGAGGPAGQATLQRLAAAGATVVGADAHAERLEAAVAAARSAHRGATVTGDAVDLLDFAAVQSWAAGTEKEFGRIDGLVHLVGGWRGARQLTESALDDWQALHELLVRTVQHTSLAFRAPLERSGNGRFVLVSAAAAAKPTAGNAAYAAAKSAAEAWTLALADAFRKAAGQGPPPAAAGILVVKALVHDGMRAQRPEAKFAGFTDVTELAENIRRLWALPTEHVNGNRQWLTPAP